jgi:hypothetical protein
VNAYGAKTTYCHLSLRQPGQFLLSELIVRTGESASREQFRENNNVAIPILESNLAIPMICARDGLLAASSW